MFYIFRLARYLFIYTIGFECNLDFSKDNSIIKLLCAIRLIFKIIFNGDNQENQNSNWTYKSSLCFFVTWTLRDRERKLNPIRFTTLITDIKCSSPTISLSHPYISLFLSHTHTFKSCVIKLKSWASHDTSMPFWLFPFMFVHTKILRFYFIMIINYGL